MKHILDVDGQPIDPLWIAEFSGFMLADGDIGITSYPRKCKDRHGELKYSYRFLHARAALGQRDDNRPLLEAVCVKLGGHVSKMMKVNPIVHANGQAYVQNPACYWHCFSKEGVQRVVDILRLVQLPHRMLNQKLDILQEFLDLTTGPGQKYDEATKQHRWELKERLSACHKYQA